MRQSEHYPTAKQEANKTLPNNNMPHAGYVYLGIGGVFDVNDFTSYVGITPTRAWTKGMKDPERGLPKSSIWNYSSEKVYGFVNIHELSSDLVELLYPKREILRAALKRFNADAILQTVIYIDPLGDYQPDFAIGFGDKVVSFVSSLCGQIDVDSYLGAPIDWTGYIEREP